MAPPLLALLLAAPARAAEPAFGAELSAGPTVGTVVANWAVPGVQGGFTVRYDAFTRPRETEAPRLGLSIFASTSAWPLQHAQEWVDDELVDQGPFHMLHYGVLVALRQPPARWSGTAALGFTRLDLDDWYDGVLAVPLVVGEAGVRAAPDRLPEHSFLDLHLRGGWGNARGLEGDWEDWWLVQLVVAGGYRLR